MPPWLCATHTSSRIGGIASRVSIMRSRIFPTTGPLPCVTSRRFLAPMSGSSAFAALAATASCSSVVPRMLSGCVALPPIATSSASGIATPQRFRWTASTAASASSVCRTASARAL